jgi:hypothetical protein
MRADYLRVTGQGKAAELASEYAALLDAYERGGLPFERVLTRLSYARWLQGQARLDEANAMNAGALDLCRRHHMAMLERDALALRQTWLRDSQGRPTNYPFRP